MSFERYIKNNLLKKVNPDFDQIRHQLKRAEQDLQTAQANLKIDVTWALTITYHAMIRACRALVYAKGYLPTANQSHKTVVELAGVILGKEYDDLISKLNRLRRRRHNFIYDSQNHVNTEEADAALETAKKLINKIKASVKG